MLLKKWLLHVICMLLDSSVIRLILSSKAMRSVNIIEYSIKNRVETNISVTEKSDYYAIIFLFYGIFFPFINSSVIRLILSRAVPRTGPAGPRPEAQNLKGHYISKIDCRCKIL